MQKIALLGVDIKHSLSPEFQNNLFKKYSLPYYYEILDLENSSLDAGLQLLKENDYIGANITSPFKIEILNHINQFSKEVILTGSANTILIKDGQVSGFNTDIYGFYESLKNDEIVGNEFSCGVLGSGGAARAVLLGLMGFDNLNEVVVYARDIDKAKVIVNYFNQLITKNKIKKKGGLIIKSERIDKIKSHEILINASSAGMTYQNELYINAENIVDTKLCYDLIYKRKTNFLTLAENLKIRTKNGLDMLYLQAKKSFTIWTGVEI